MTAPDTAFVFNIVWTGSVFPYLQYFVLSQMEHSGASFRFVANGCPPDQVELMRAFAAEHEDRVVEVFETSTTMEAHGVALDRVFRERDDGGYFCFVDPDIVATGPFVAEFAAALAEGCAGVTSGQGVWNDDTVVPDGHIGVPGECFWSRDGYLFGSPHFAMYHRAPVAQTMQRWSVGFGSAGKDLSETTKAKLVAAGHAYWIYDTGKIVNILLQEDGHRLCHFEHDALLHIGGMSHYLSPPEKKGRALADGEEPDQRWPWPQARLDVARYTAGLLRSLCDGAPSPTPPAGLEDRLARSLTTVEAALRNLMARHGPSSRV